MINPLANAVCMAILKELGTPSLQHHAGVIEPEGLQRGQAFSGFGAHLQLAEGGQKRAMCHAGASGPDVAGLRIERRVADIQPAGDAFPLGRTMALIAMTIPPVYVI